MEVMLYSDFDVKPGLWDNNARKNPMSINDNIGLQTYLTMNASSVTNDFPSVPFYCDLDLHGMRNLCV